jgi:hypothetical protein
VKGVRDREILETYLNSASRNTSETDIFPHGKKSLLTSVIVVLLAAPYKPQNNMTFLVEHTRK